MRHNIGTPVPILSSLCYRLYISDTFGPLYHSLSALWTTRRIVIPPYRVNPSNDTHRMKLMATSKRDCLNVFFCITIVTNNTLIHLERRHSHKKKVYRVCAHEEKSKGVIENETTQL